MNLCLRLLFGPCLGVSLVGCGQTSDAPLTVGAGALGGFERAELVCKAQAEAQGYVVEGVQFTQSSVQGGGRITGAETLLIVHSANRIHPLRCAFTYRTGAAQLSMV